MEFLKNEDKKYQYRDYISTQDLDNAGLERILELAGDLKRAFRNDISHKILSDRTLFMIFFDKSTRTRNSFEAGITQLGGHAHNLTPDIMQISHGESPRDTGIILSSYGHGIAIRHDLFPGLGNSYIREVAKNAMVPVINMQCDIDHPCQTIADLMTAREVFGKNLKGRKIAVSWAYAPSYAKPMSVPQGLMMLMPRFGLDVVVAHPPEFKLMPEAIKTAKENASKYGGKISFTDSMDDAFENADIVYPKSWGAMDLFDNPEESLELAAKYKDWICDDRRMEIASDESIYMHCLPADRGSEVTDSVIDGSHSHVFQEAENRLHTCKAIMALTMSGKRSEMESY